MNTAPLCFAALTLVLVPACKKKQDKKSDPPAQTEKPAPVAEPAPTAVSDEPLVAPKIDPAAIDAALESLADATVKRAGEADKSLPTFKATLGIACGDDPPVAAALAHIGFDVAGLKEGQSFLFRDVCVGWRPYVEPVTEMYWMISAGLVGDAGVLPIRQCIRIGLGEAGASKDPIVVGPCLASGNP